MLRQRFLIFSGIALLCFAALLAVDRMQPQLLLRLRALERDAVSSHGRTTAANPDLVFLAIDSDSVGLDATDIKELYDLSGSTSLEARALKLMSKSWPWPREVYALVLQRLVDAGAKVVAFDLTFPTETPEDAPFRLALDRYREHVVIASNFVSAASRGFSTVGASLTRPPESLIPETTPMDDRVAYSNFWPDEDDVVRHAQYRITFEQAQGDLPEADSERYLSFAALALSKAGHADAVPAGLDEHLFRFTAAPRPRISAPFLIRDFRSGILEAKLPVGGIFPRQDRRHRGGGELAARRAPDAFRLHAGAGAASQRDQCRAPPRVHLGDAAARRSPRHRRRGRAGGFCFVHDSLTRAPDSRAHHDRCGLGGSGALRF